MRTYSWHGTGGSLSDTYDVTVAVRNLQTVSGAPSSVTVSTPTVDFGSPVEAQISWSPAVGTLEWRASNTPFGRDDVWPAWNNPNGSFRYWQARVTWTQPNYLLERIHLRGGNVRIVAVEWAGFGWLLHHRNITSPYSPHEKPVGGVPRSTAVGQGDSVEWSGDDDEYITTRDK